MGVAKRALIGFVLVLISNLACAVTNKQVFAYAEAMLAGVFPGTAVSGQVTFQGLTYDYRYYAGTGNYLAIDNTNMIHVLGPISGGALTPVGAVASFADTITAWEATQSGTTTPPASGLMGGAKQGTVPSLTGVTTTFVGKSTTGATDGNAATASFSAPKGITTDGTNLYVTDSANKKIRKIEIATGAVTTLAGSGALGALDGAGAAASFSTNLTGITTDGTNLFVSDTNNYLIRQIVIATGAVTTLAGSGVAGSVDGTGTGASFKSPRGITTDGKNLYLADISGYTIRKIVIATGVVTTIAGSGVAGSVDGTGNAASFKGPYGITTDGTNLYVADSSGYTIRKIVIASGAVTTLAGTGTSGTADGDALLASFNTPRGLTTDGTNLYEVDYGSSTIRKIVISSGAVTTLAGTGAAGSSNGSGKTAAFSFPDGITTDGASLYVADSGNNMVRKIQ